MRVYNYRDKATVMGVFIQLKTHILITNGTDIRIHIECLDLAISGNTRKEQRPDNSRDYIISLEMAEPFIHNVQASASLIAKVCIMAVLS